MTTDQHTANQLVLRDLCFATAVANSINTFHWQCIFNDGYDGCEYEFLNDDGTIFSAELLRDTDADEPTLLVTVKRNQWRAERDGIGETALYMRLHESQHPALISEHCIVTLAARRRAARAVHDGAQ